jgi:hypothetical protein
MSSIPNGIFCPSTNNVSPMLRTVGLACFDECAWLPPTPIPSLTPVGAESWSYLFDNTHLKEEVAPSRSGLAADEMHVAVIHGMSNLRPAQGAGCGRRLRPSGMLTVNEMGTKAAMLLGRAGSRQGC